MKLWVTKPESYEVYMGGLKRSFHVWMSQPIYSHATIADRYLQEERLTEIGWRSPFDRSGPSNIRVLLEQYPDFDMKIWDRVIYAECPPEFEDYNKWADEHWHDIGEEWIKSPWETKSRIHFKRFLLELDTVEGTVKLIKPMVQHADECGDVHHAHAERIVTDQIPDKLKRFMGSYSKEEYAKAFVDCHGHTDWL